VTLERKENHMNRLFVLGALAVGLAWVGCATSPTQGGDDDDNADCGNGVCDPGETEKDCPADCTPTKCGDNKCTGEETAASCPQDCARCGDGTCSSTENLTSCPQDCAVCGDGICSPGETGTSCPQDCDANLTVRNSSTFTIDFLHVFPCGSSDMGPDQLGANVIPPNGTFTVHEIPVGCWNFRADGTSGSLWTRTGTELTAGETFTWTLLN
jgi:hypothetical protein